MSTDNSPPEVLEVLASSTTSLRVEFSEIVTESTAENVGNYLIDQGTTVSTAAMAPDSRTVVLTTSKLNPTVTYNLSVSNVKNMAGLPIVADNYPFSIFPGDSIIDQVIPRLKVYPNPATDQLTLEVELVTAETIVINIYDSVGKGFYFGEVSFEAGSNIMNLDISHLTDGLYYIKLNSRATNISGRKLLITN